MPPCAVTLSAFEPHSPRALRDADRAADLIVCQPQWPVLDALAARLAARVVYDLYDPEAFETIELYAHRPVRSRGGSWWISRSTV